MVVVGVTCPRCKYRYVYKDKCPRCDLDVKEYKRKAEYNNGKGKNAN